MLSLLLNIVGVFVAIVAIIIAFFKWRYNYWKNLGVPYCEPTIPCGNLTDVFFRQKSIGEATEDLYNSLKSKKVIHGGMYFFHMPMYVPIDPDLLKQIMQVDFEHFTDHISGFNERDDPLTAHLFALEGQRWRNLRVKLTPTFTSGKMKIMFPIMVKISQELSKVLEQHYQEGKPVEAKDISARFTTDVIGNCAFGIDCNSLKDPNTEFRVHGKRINKFNAFEFATLLLTACFPNLMKSLRVRTLPRAAADFFANVIKTTTDYREQNNVRRNDAIQLLLDMKNIEGTLTYQELAAQAFLFFVAGFDTSSVLMCFALLELAANEDVQKTLREEVNSVLEKNNGEFTYEGLADMHYLTMVINETLRKYPPFAAMTRICTKDYPLPNDDAVLKKGEKVMLLIRGLHYDPEYFPEPQKFDPTRFNAENKSKRHQFAFIPFGEGPRMCIGIRFAMMQAKVGLASIIKDFKIKLNSQTKYPVKLDHTDAMTSVAGGVWIDLEKIESPQKK